MTHLQILGSFLYNLQLKFITTTTSISRNSIEHFVAACVFPLLPH